MDTAFATVPRTEAEVAAFFASHGYDALAASVPDQGIDGEVLTALDHGSLKDLGILKLGQRMRLLKLIAKLRGDRDTDGEGDCECGAGLSAEDRALLHRQDERIIELQHHMLEFRRMAKVVLDAMAPQTLRIEATAPPSPHLLSPPCGPASPASAVRRGHRRARSSASSRSSLGTSSAGNLSPSSALSPRSPVTPPSAPADPAAPDPGPAAKHPHSPGRHVVARKPSLTVRARSPIPPSPAAPAASGSAHLPLHRAATLACSGRERPLARSRTLAPPSSDPLSPPSTPQSQQVQTTSDEPVASVLAHQLSKLPDAAAWQKHLMIVRYGSGSQIKERCLSYDDVPLRVFRNLRSRHPGPDAVVDFVIKAATDVPGPLRRARDGTCAEAWDAGSGSWSLEVRGGDPPPEGAAIASAALAVCGHQAEQPDEINLRVGEVVFLQSKLNGRYYVRRATTPGPSLGWVPGACLLETHSPIRAASPRDALAAPLDPAVLASAYSRRAALLDHAPPPGGYAGELRLARGGTVRVYKRWQHWSYALDESTGERGWVPSWILVQPSSALFGTTAASDHHRSLASSRRLLLQRSATDVRQRKRDAPDAGAGVRPRRGPAAVPPNLEIPAREPGEPREPERRAAAAVAPPCSTSPLPPIHASPRWLIDPTARR